MVGRLTAPASALRAHQELFAYWASLKSARGGLPGRGHIRPDDFKRHLPTISLVDVDHEPLRFRVRLAGTGLYGLFGREVTGLPLEQVWTGAAGEYWREQLSAVVASGRPAVGLHTADWRGGTLSVMWLRLPLASDGRRVDMILGYDAPIGMAEPQTGIRAA